MAICFPCTPLFRSLDEVGDASPIGERCAGRGGVVGQLAADQLADQRIALDGVDELPAVATVGHITAGVREDDLVELLVDFRLADQAGEGPDAGDGRPFGRASCRESVCPYV